jgi:hypothetical protein
MVIGVAHSLGVLYGFYAIRIGFKKLGCGVAVRVAVRVTVRVRVRVRVGCYWHDRMLSCWVAHPRPRGAPRMTYGRSVGKALDTFGHPRPQQVARARRRPPRFAGDATQRSAESRPDYRATVPRAVSDPPRPAHPLTHTGPSDPWRPPTPPSRTPCSSSLRRRGSA